MVFLGFIGAQNASALGKIGHRVTGQITSNHLTPKAKQQVAKLLQGQTLAQVSNWADHMRSNPHYFWQKLSPSWHYVSIPDNLSYDKSRKNPKGDVYQAIASLSLLLADKPVPDGPIKQGLVDYFGDLNDKSKQEDIKRFALKFLMHLVGDVHQPLHVGYKKDLGGNKIQVEWFYKKTNLHRVWDTDLINYQELSYTEMTTFIDTDDAELIKSIQQAPLEEWLIEGKQLRKGAYQMPEGRIGYNYIYTNGPIIEQQLLKAGLRMAKILNDIYN